MRGEKLRSEVLIKALELGKDIDTDSLLKSLSRKPVLPSEILAQRLQRGCIFALVGAALILLGLPCAPLFSQYDEDLVQLSMVFGCVSLAIGLGYLITYLVTRRQHSGADDIDDKGACNRAVDE